MLMREDVPLLELAVVTDFYVDGLHHIEVIGDNARMVYFIWKMIEGRWQRVAAEFARVAPITSLSSGLCRKDVPIVRRSPETIAGLHS